MSIPSSTFSPEQESAYREALRLLSPKLTPFIPHTPTARQTAFLLLDDFREAFYGGAAGGGKSDALLMAALQYVDVPGYAALILRKSYTDLALPGAIMDRAHGWLAGTAANWDAQEHRWAFPSGAALQFGYLERPADRYRYQSAEFQFVGVDELTQFQKADYDYMHTRVRRTVELQNARVPLRTRSASNPGNIGHEWVRNHFIPQREKDPVTGLPVGQLVYPRNANGQLRPFIPALLSDNPHIDREAYAQSLALVDPVLRRQMLSGDWEAREEGGRFRREWFHVLDNPPHLVKKVRVWDLAGTEDDGKSNPDWTAGALVGLTAQGQVVIVDIVRGRWSAAKAEGQIRATADRDNPEKPGFPIRIEQEPGSAGKSLVSYYQRVVLGGYNVRPILPVSDKVTRATPLMALSEAGNVFIVRGPWNAAFLDEVEPFGAFDATGKQLWDHDDQVDAVSGGYLALMERGTATSSTYAQPVKREPVIRRGGLVLRGRQYIDKA